MFLEQLAARNYNIDLSRIDPSCVAAVLFRLSCPLPAVFLFRLF
jgi:hypothetical protein